MESKQSPPEEKKFYVTTPIYYVNAAPHMGTGYTTILADIVARTKRKQGYRVKFVTGSDEHSQNIADKAAELGLDPLEFCNRNIPAFLEAWKLLEISDYEFYRTSSPRHREVVQKFFQRIYELGDIYKGTYSGWYHTTDNRFLDPSEVPEDPESKPYLKFLTEEAYYFRLSKYEGYLLEFYDQHPDFIHPDFRRTEMLNRIREGLKDLCISRSSTEWGIPLPWDRNHVFYVWVDALLTYLTGSGFDIDAALAALERGEDPMAVQPAANFWPCDLHIMAVDIPWFHAVIWPAMLKSFGIPAPKKLLVHGFWNFEGTKMSKSKGNVFHPKDAVALVGADGVRYFVVREVPVGLDGNFSVRALAERYNYDLANDLGNLLHRTLNMALKFLGGVIPAPTVVFPRDLEIKELADRVPGEVIEHYESLRFKEGLELAWELVRELNRYIDTTKPWELNKEGKKEEIGTIFHLLIEAIRRLLIVLSPVMPGACDRYWQQLGFEGRVSELTFDALSETLPENHKVGQPEVVFPRLDLEDLEEEFIRRKEALTGEKVERIAAEEKPAPKEEKMAEKPTEEKEWIEIGDFMKLNLITAKVLSAEPVEGADKLIKLTVDDGSRKDRVLVAGIRPWYDPEELVGRTIVILDNLKPKKLRGVLSEGMLLAATDESQGERVVRIVTVDGEVAPGSKLS